VAHGHSRSLRNYWIVLKRHEGLLPSPTRRNSFATTAASICGKLLVGSDAPVLGPSFCFGVRIVVTLFGLLAIIPRLVDLFGIWHALVLPG
jgi:hypothetical protein